MEWLADDEKGEFDCDYCTKNGLQGIRNCEGETAQPVPFKVFEEVHFGCPLKTADQEWSLVVNFITGCEGGGMAINRIMPSQLLNETAFYVNARRIVLSAQRKIEKWKTKQEKDKDGSI